MRIDGPLFVKAAVGKVYEDAMFIDDEGNSVLTFVAESDSGGATSPCFDAWGPEVHGVPVRASAISVYGYAPTATSTITIYDDKGGSNAYAVTTAGSTDFRTAATSSWYFDGALRFSIDTMGAASKRWRITMYFRKSTLPAAT